MSHKNTTIQVPAAEEPTGVNSGLQPFAFCGIGGGVLGLMPRQVAVSPYARKDMVGRGGVPTEKKGQQVCT